MTPDDDISNMKHFHNENSSPPENSIIGWDLIKSAWTFLNRVFDSAAPVMTDYGLHQKSLVLLALMDTGDTPQDLAHLLRTPAPTLSHMLRELEARGLIERSLDPKDKRRFRLRRTAAGDDALQAGINAVNKAMANHCAQLTESEMATLIAAIPLLVRLTDDR